MAEIMEFRFIDHSNDVLIALQTQLGSVLEAWGNQAVSHAKSNITRAGRVDTGALRNSINHIVDNSERAVYVGTNLEYAPYHEYGTGIYADDGKGRKGWWVYVTGSHRKGRNTGRIYTRAQAAQIVAILRAKGLDAHMTQGMKPIHYLRNAIRDHIDEYKQIADQYMKNI